MAKKELEIEDDIIDLTELIESGNSGDKRAASAYARTAKMQAPPDDDFDSLLARETGSEPHKVDPDETLDMSGMGGIDNLLDSLDIPAQPGESGAPAKTPESDLDSALDDLLAPEPESGPAEDAAPELDDLLADLPEEDEPAQPKSQEKAQPRAAAPDLEPDLDDILSSLDEPAPKQQAAPPPDKSEEITADLDDILNEVPPPPPPEPEIAEAPAPEPVRDALADFADLPPEDDKLAEPAPAEPELTEEPEPAEPAMAADSGEKLPDAPEPEMVQASIPALGADAPAPTLQAAPAAIWSPDTVASLCRNLSGIHDSATQTALQGFARELGEQSAHVEDFAVQLEQLAKRVMACESRLSAARVKIANLEKSLESTAALDDLLREGTPLHAGFLGLIAAAVSNALQGLDLDSPRQDPEILKRLDSLTVRVAETTERVADLEKRVEAGESQASGEDADDMGKLINGLENTDARIAALEKRLGALNAEIGEKLEKTAAATAARVLQEEIARLIQDGNGI